MRTAGLIEQYGPGMGLPELAAILSADCPRWQAPTIYDMCRAYIAG